MLANQKLLRRVDAIHHLNGYTGSHEPGIPKALLAATSASASTDHILQQARSLAVELEDTPGGEDEVDEFVMDDEVFDQTESITKYLEALYLVD